MDSNTSEFADYGHGTPIRPLAFNGMGGNRGLSDAALAVWAKYDPSTDGWLPLHQHMKDSADVAARLWDEWLPGNVKKLLADAVGGFEAARSLFIFLAGIHDIGKASPAFSQKVPSLTASTTALGLTPLSGDASAYSQHWTIGHVVLDRWLRDEHHFMPAAAEALASVIGGHHGNPPGPELLAPHMESTWRLGVAKWAEVRRELLTWMTDYSGAEAHFAAWSTDPVSRPALMLFSAGVIVSDWIASNNDFFPLVGPQGGVQPDRSDWGWEALGLPPAWAPSAPPHDPERLLRERFPSATTARPLQQALVEAAWQMTDPGIVVVEAPMGEGKTEAALMAAEILAHKFSCGGVLVALPTMATSDAMFGRVRAWIENLPHDGDLPTYLAHSKAGLNQEYRSLPPFEVAGVYDDESADGARGAVAVAQSWLSGRKKGVLATFVIATIDQVLFGALKSRHLALRHLALAGKVVIVDEVHAADAYMRVYLTRVLHWLGAYQIPVVLLSATLPPAQREELLSAYESGAEEPPPIVRGGLDDLFD